MSHDLRGIDLAQIVSRQLDLSCGDVLIEGCDLVVPGIGTIHGFCASSQASAITVFIGAESIGQAITRAR